MPLSIVRQDITKVQCDVIVNATDRYVSCDVGVAKAILEAAGKELLTQLPHYIDDGEVVVTPAFNLPCKAILHVVGPVWRFGYFGERERLARCYESVLQKALALGMRSVAIPLISSGARGFPKDLVLTIAVDVIAKFLWRHELDVQLVVYDKNSFTIGKELFGDIADYISKNYEGDQSDAAYEKELAEVYKNEIGDEYEEDEDEYDEEEDEEEDEYVDDYVSKTEEISAEESKAEEKREEEKGKVEKSGEEDDICAKRLNELRKVADSARKSEDIDFGSYFAAAPPQRFRRPVADYASRDYSAPHAAAQRPKRYDEKDVDEIILTMDDSFTQMLFKLIDARHMSDVECYKKANVSRQTWHKIINDDNYRPSKTTVIAFAIALRLNLEETKLLLQTVGFALSKSIYFDVIIEYFISQGEYDVFKINNVLYKFDQPLLGV